MKRNVASQTVGAQMVSASDGSAFTGSVTVYVTGDAGTQAVGSVGSGACTHEGNGFHTYAPAQAETNYDHVAFTFIGTGAIPATVQIYTTFPQTGDSYARLGAPAGASVSADVAAVQSDTNDIQTRLPAALVSGRMDSSVGAMAADTLTGAALDASAVTEIQSGLSTLDAAGVRTAVGLASANLDTQLAAIDDYIDTEVGAIKGVTDKLDTAMELDGAVYRYTANALELAPSGSAPTAAEVADAVWDEAVADHLGAGSTGAALNAAGSAGDPWITPLPGAYGSGTAGKIIGDNINATISSRASQTSVDTVDDFLDTEVAAIKAKTDNLPADPADASDIAASFSTVNSTLSTLSGYIDTEVSAILAAVDTEVGAIKAKTDNLPAAPAAVGDIPTAVENADALLNRDMSTGTDSGSPTVRTVRQALRFLRNKWSISGTTLTVTKEDDTTASWTSTVSTTAGADPVTGNDPA
jgi:hypothetical protein